jgi:hypothetical protein
MLHFYIDESGTGLRDKRSPYFVLAAVAIPTRELAQVDEQVNAFKRQLIPFAEPEDFEFKVRELRRGERFFRGIPWQIRAQAILEMSSLMAALPCRVLAVQVHKGHLTDYIEADDQLYALAFRRLVDMVENVLEQGTDTGMLMVDSRSDLHSSVQDRRLLDVYRHWQARKPSRIVGIPWFGFSAFYVGLQLADFAAYMIDFVSNEVDTPFGSEALQIAFRRIENKVQLVRIP